MLVLVAVVALLAVAGAAAAGEPGASPAAVAEPASSPTATPALTLTAAPDDGHRRRRGDAHRAAPRRPRRDASSSAARSPAPPASALVGPLVTSARGVATYRVLPGTTTTYRVEYAGDGVQWLPASAEVTVSVRPRVTFFAAARVYRGDRAGLAVAVRPAHPGATVTLQQWKDGAWAEWRSLQLGADSRAQLTWRTDRVGDLAPARRHAGRRRASGGTLARLQGDRRPAEPLRRPHRRQGHHRRRHLAVPAALLLLRPRAALVPLRHRAAVAAHAARPLQDLRQGHVAGRAVRRTDHVLPPAVRHPRHQRAVAAQRFPRNFSHGCTRLAERERHLALRPRAARHAGLERAS